MNRAKGVIYLCVAVAHAVFGVMLLAEDGLRSPEVAPLLMWVVVVLLFHIALRYLIDAVRSVSASAEHFGAQRNEGSNQGQQEERCDRQ